MGNENIEKELDNIKTVYRDIVINYEIDEYYRGEYIKEINAKRKRTKETS